MEKQNNQKPRLSRGEPPHRALHRASMTGQAPRAGEKQMPTRISPQQQERARKKRPSTRKIHPVRCVCVILLCAIFCVFALYSALSLSTLSRVKNYRYEIASEGQPLDGCENYLLVGRHADNQTPDWIAMLTLNSAHKRYFVYMIHPELYVSIPDDTIGSLRDAYRSAGDALICRAISANFNLRIDGVISVSAAGREKISDIFSLNAKIEPEIGIAEGFDYMRSKCDAISAVMKAINPPDIADALAFRSDAAGEILTSISTAKLYGRSLYMPFRLRGWQCTTGCIPFDGTYDIEQRPDGEDVLAVDLDQNVEMLKQYLTE